MLICHLYIFFGEVSVQFICPFLNWVDFFYYWVLRVLYIVGDQNMPPQNIPAWREDCFQLKTIEKKQIQEKKKSLTLNPSCPFNEMHVRTLWLVGIGISRHHTTDKWKSFYFSSGLLTKSIDFYHFPEFSSYQKKKEQRKTVKQLSSCVCAQTHKEKKISALSLPTRKGKMIPNLQRLF